MYRSSEESLLQKAAPKMTINATPVIRPEVGVLLQDWSTATTQTINSRIAPAPKAFSHIIRPLAAREIREKHSRVDTTPSFSAGESLAQ